VGRGKVACSALSGRSLARALHRRPWAWTPTLHPLWLASNAEIAGEQDSLGVRSPGCGFGDAEDSGRRPALPRDVLDHLLDAVRGGAGRAVVRDEPGVGKTALLDYLVEQASGCRVARVAGASRKIELAFAGLHRLCADAGHLERLPRPSARCCGPPEIDATSSRRSMPGSEGRPAGGTWTQWPWPQPTQVECSRRRPAGTRHARPNWQLKVDALPGSDGPTPLREATRSTCTRATWRATLTGCSLHPPSRPAKWLPSRVGHGVRRRASSPAEPFQPRYVGDGRGVSPEPRRSSVPRPGAAPAGRLPGR
jgi:hypothetical protein